jgi:hypothetical protein
MISRFAVILLNLDFLFKYANSDFLLFGLISKFQKFFFRLYYIKTNQMVKGFAA